uniref:PH domain-containing protein n=1 Tax=Amphimedon queenslandica TaxID=400682 RepID=A0A1X7VH81_AMPQE
MAASSPSSPTSEAPALKKGDEEIDGGKEGTPPVSSDAVPIGSTVGSGTSWELIPDPPPIPEEHKHLIPPTTSTHTETPVKLLCGYLRKETTHSLIKTWKQRWVVVDDDKCSLNYFNSKTDLLPQGSIDLSNATFSYAIENVGKFQFEIQTPSCTYSFQAASQDAMFSWLEALKKKRRRYGEKGGGGGGKSPEVGLMSLANKKKREGEGERQPEQEENGVVVDSDQPMNTPGNSFSDIQNFIRKFPKPNAVVKRLSTSGLNIKGGGAGGGAVKVTVAAGGEEDRKSSFYLDIAENQEEQQLESPVVSLTDLQKPNADNSDTNNDAMTTPPTIRSRNPIGGWVKKVTTSRQSEVIENCQSCRKLQESLDFLKNELSLREQEVKDRDEMMEFLRSEIRHSDLQDKVRKELIKNSSDNDDKIDVLTQRDQLIQSLQNTLESLRIENDRIETELKSKRDKCAELNEEVTLYKETLSVKDQVVMELTNKIFSLQTGGQVPNNPQDVMLPTTTKMLELEIIKLKETVGAYKEQNAFLSQEIVELNNLRTNDSNDKKRLEGKIQELEAELVKVQSKYVILLKEAQTPKHSHDSDVVSQMMAEAMEQQETGKDRSSSDTQYDAYGFKYEKLEADPDESLDSYAKRLDQAQQPDEALASHIAKWDHFMAQYTGGRELVSTAELKLLIRGGVPMQHRGRVWKFCVRRTIQNRYIPGFYHQILADNASKTSVALSQIELDLLRTLPSNKYYNHASAPGSVTKTAHK